MGQRDRAAIASSSVRSNEEEMEELNEGAEAKPVRRCGGGRPYPHPVCWNGTRSAQGPHGQAVTATSVRFGRRGSNVEQQNVFVAHHRPGKKTQYKVNRYMVISGVNYAEETLRWVWRSHRMMFTNKPVSAHTTVHTLFVERWLTPVTLTPPSPKL